MSENDKTSPSPSSSTPPGEEKKAAEKNGQPARQDRRTQREERLAEALRANLKRRKEQQRGRRQPNKAE